MSDDRYGFLSNDGYPEEGPNPLIKPEPTAEKDVAALADEVARILHPHPYYEPDERGRYTIERPANGSDSTMTVLLDTDGHNSMRALTYREVCEAVLASDWFKARVFPPARTEGDQ